MLNVYNIVYEQVLERLLVEADPKVGTGKKPKGSSRRLYTDENPKDTVSIKFATPADARATIAKVKKVNKPYARKIQILTVMEQRAKVMGKTQDVNVAKKANQSLRKKPGKQKANTYKNADCKSGTSTKQDYGC